MINICKDKRNFHYQPSHQLLFLNKSPREIDIPPRKLLMQGSFINHDGSVNNMVDSSDDDSNSDNLISSDHFRMYEFKVRNCTRSGSHDWTHCPFAHPGEKARRRDPRLFHYSGKVCPEYRSNGTCRRGELCEFSHGVFECWLYPSRYRTELCKYEKSCKRNVCFFAHTPHQLRILPSNFINSQNYNPSCKNSKNHNNSKIKKNNNGVLCCGSNHSCSFSPTYPIFDISHLLPPLISLPSFQGNNNNNNNNNTTTTMPCSDDICCEDHQKARSDSPPFVCENLQNNNDKQHFVLSPTISSSPSKSFSNNDSKDGKNFNGIDDIGVWSSAIPNLTWVNDMLM